MPKRVNGSGSTAPAVVSLKEACRRLGISYTTGQRWVSEHDFPVLSLPADQAPSDPVRRGRRTQFWFSSTALDEHLETVRLRRENPDDDLRLNFNETCRLMQLDREQGRHLMDVGRFPLGPLPPRSEHEPMQFSCQQVQEFLSEATEEQLDQLQGLAPEVLNHGAKKPAKTPSRAHLRRRQRRSAIAASLEIHRREEGFNKLSRAAQDRVLSVIERALATERKRMRRRR